MFFKQVSFLSTELNIIESVGGVSACGGKLDSNSVPQSLVIFRIACVYYCHGHYFNIDTPKPYSMPNEPESPRRCIYDRE